MPTKKKTTVKTVKPKKTVVKKSVARKTAPKKLLPIVQDVMEEVKKIPNVCRSCNALPMGSIELVSLLLVVTFALSAILLTSVYAMEQQSEHIDNLETQVQYYQGQE